MRRVKGYIHIQAPVQRVRTLAGAGSSEWMVAHDRGLLRPARTATWDATEIDGGGTRFTLQMEYRSHIACFESMAADSLRQSVAQSLSRLKHLAEQPGG